jgi:hypothetical protein
MGRYKLPNGTFKCPVDRGLGKALELTWNRCVNHPGPHTHKHRRLTLDWHPPDQSGGAGGNPRSDRCGNTRGGCWHPKGCRRQSNHHWVCRRRTHGEWGDVCHGNIGHYIGSRPPTYHHSWNWKSGHRHGCHAKSTLDTRSETSHWCAHFNLLNSSVCRQVHKELSGQKGAPPAIKTSPSRLLSHSNDSNPHL